MLSSKHRLPGNSFPALLKSKINYQHVFFNIKLKKRLSPKPVFRAAIVVSTKISKQAVVRNRIKRLLRQALNFYLPSLQSNHDFLLFAKPAIRNKSLTQIKSALQSVFIRAKILKNEKNNP